MFPRLVPISRQREWLVRAIVFVACLATANALMAQTPRLDQTSSMRSREQLVSEVAKMRAIVYDANARFSRSAMLADLRRLLAAATQRTDSHDAERDLLLMIGLVESKGGEPKEVIAAFERALPIVAEPALSDERLARTHVMLADHLKDQKDYARAADHYRHGIAHMGKSAAFTEDQRLGIGQHMGYVLHEAGRYQDALDTNRTILAAGEKLHGATSPVLRTVVTNIAQNLHALGRKSEAEPYLQRALMLARAEGSVWNEQDLLFQHGVLAFELGDHAAARRHMLERLAVIKRAKRDDLVAGATEDLRILDEKITRGRK
jgi:tetratricopeptide (TPR) repeat protein